MYYPFFKNIIKISVGNNTIASRKHWAKYQLEQYLISIIINQDFLNDNKLQ